MSDERFVRVSALIGTEGGAALSAAHVVIVGYGAVGSFCAEALIRSGVSHLRIIDFDVYRESNFNRQLGADTTTLGHPKVEIGRLHLTAVNPEADVEAIHLSVVDGSLSSVFVPFADGVRPSYIVDAIDALDAKVSLLHACVRHGVRVFSSMGAARKDDPGQVRVADISQTSVCPLAREVRRRLRHLGVEGGITCVYSTQVASRMTAPSGGVGRPVLGSIITVTGVFGLMMASEVIRDVLKSAETERQD